MQQINKDRWKIIESRGILRFVLLYGVVWWGGVMFMLRFVLDHFVWHRNWDTEWALTHIVLSVGAGAVVGLLNWMIIKARHS